ncbi:alpha/beta-hydrolase [Setomelanomma holmii]|uniref:Alpha/beta-hydrolase n=1 Tax=Setomelanomma holmii TaxID=210430 RepID=A0A9P4H3Q0_9PLEO|nr:alpha/beta-hydrolase [Setomelanomma holmii]
MRLKSGNPWQSQPTHSELVNIGTHALHASVSGPIRHINDPILIFFTGAGASCAVYQKLQQQLSAFVRVLFYDRAGYDRSTLPAGDDKIVASDTAHDLTKFLSITHLAPPYILVGHSFGGVPARAFLELHKANPDIVAGIMLLDCATELMLAFFPRVPPLELHAVAKNVDWEELTHLQRESGMSDEEWQYAIEAQERCAEAAKREDTHASAHQLALTLQLEKQTLGSRPLSVLRLHAVKDYQMLYDAGVAKGDGTEEERKVAKDFIEKWGLFHDQFSKAQIWLSSNTTFKYFCRWGHDMPIRNATLAAEEIRELVERVKKNLG